MTNKTSKLLFQSLFLITTIILSSFAATTMNTTAAGNPDKKALLVVSFGTSYADTRAKTIEASEKVLASAFPGYDLKRAFTSQIIIDILKKRDNIEIDNPIQAMEKIVAGGYGEILIQPLHIINGEEYHDLLKDIAPYQEKFSKFSVGEPILSSYQDYVDVVKGVMSELPALGDKEALVFMGHGTPHPANSAYAALDFIFKDEGFTNVFVGTVEGFPTLDTVIKSLEKNKIEKVTLMPFMVVAGDHAQNDMAGNEDTSWKMILKSKGFEVNPVLTGLGESKKVQQMYIAHAKAALEAKKEK